MLPVYFLLALILLALAVLMYRQSLIKPSEPDLTKAIDTLINLANEKLGDKNQQIQTDLQNKKESIEKMIKQVLDQLSQVERDRVGSFQGLREALDNNRKITEQLSATTEGLKKVLSNNQLRGAFGEKVAEDLLKQIGFVIGQQYTKQEAEGSGRPDFTLYLPDQTKINVDSKFPYSNLVKMSETDDPSQKNSYLKLFEADIRKKVTEVTTRDYIDPEQNTVDFVIVFIPNEMIFSFIYEKFPSLLEEAYAKKIVFAGPFGFTAVLRMVRQAYENFRYQKNVQSIIAQIKVFEKEFLKYDEEFQKLGDKINGLSRQYDQVSQTRTNKLLRVIDQIRLEDRQPSKIEA